MHFDVHLRDTVTGYERVYNQEYDYPPDCDMESALFIWQEGNYSCDCNRSIFLWEDRQRELPCGEGRIVVVSIKVRETGNQVYTEV